MDPDKSRIDALNTVHKTWQMNILWQMDPPQSRIDALNTTTPNLANKPTLADGPPSELRIDALNTSTQNLADGPPKCIMGYILWDYLAAILDSSRKGGNFLLLLNN